MVGKFLLGMVSGGLLVTGGLVVASMLAPTSPANDNAPAVAVEEPIATPKATTPEAGETAAEPELVAPAVPATPPAVPAADADADADVTMPVPEASVAEVAAPETAAEPSKPAAAEADPAAVPVPAAPAPKAPAPDAEVAAADPVDPDETVVADAGPAVEITSPGEPAAEPVASADAPAAVIDRGAEPAPAAAAAEPADPVDAEPAAQEPEAAPAVTEPAAEPPAAQAPATEAPAPEAASEPAPVVVAPAATAPEAEAPATEAAPVEPAAEAPPIEPSTPDLPTGEPAPAADKPAAEAPADTMPAPADATPGTEVPEMPGTKPATLPGVTEPAADPATAVAEDEGGSTFKPAPGLIKSGEGVIIGRDKPAEDATVDPGVTPVDPRPIAQNASPFENPDAKPPFAIVLVDPGTPDLDRAGLAALPFPVSFALDPLDPATPERAATYRAGGKEVVMLVTGIAQGAQASDVEVAFQSMEQGLPEAVAAMDLSDPTFQNNRGLASAVVPILKAQGRGLLTWDEGLNAADQVARREDLEAAVVFRNLDQAGGDTVAMRRLLDRAVFKADQDGKVSVVGTANADTVAALLEWTVEGKAATVALAPLTAVLKVD